VTDFGGGTSSCLQMARTVSTNDAGHGLAVERLPADRQTGGHACTGHGTQPEQSGSPPLRIGGDERKGIARSALVAVPSADVDEQEQAEFRDLLKKLDGIGPWLDRISPAAPEQSPRAGSSLAGDDKRVCPYQTSHAAWHAISHAVDHLHMLRLTLREAQIINMYSPYSLVRGALENASTTVWLLAPARRLDRLMRRLRLQVADIRSGERARKLAGQIGPRTLKERIDQVETIASREGLDERQLHNRPGFSEIVRTAGGHTVGEQIPELIWRLCSGMAHGDWWATLSASQRIELPGAPAGVVHNTIEANVTTLHFTMRVAVDMTAFAWQFYDQRARSPYT
jgi:hypothetical protein